MNYQNKKILALSPHTDDIEIGCAGTLTKFKENGSFVLVTNFSRSKNDENDTGEEVLKEFKKSMNFLNFEYENLEMPTRNLYKYRQEILDHLIKLDKNYDFDLIFCHSSFDKHQDHQTVQQEVFRAFKHKTILGYELPWNCAQFKTDVFVPLNENHLNKKIESLKMYDSQKHRIFMNEEYIRSLAIVRGTQIKEKFAECFELIRGVL